MNVTNALYIATAKYVLTCWSSTSKWEEIFSAFVVNFELDVIAWNCTNTARTKNLGLHKAEPFKRLWHLKCHHISCMINWIYGLINSSLSKVNLGAHHLFRFSVRWYEAKVEPRGANRESAAKWRLAVEGKYRKFRLGHWKAEQAVQV